jgi:hypothetical protein
MSRTWRFSRGKECRTPFRGIILAEGGEPTIPGGNLGAVVLVVAVLVVLIVVPLSIMKLGPRLGRRVKATLLFCSGAKSDVLKETPSTEEGNYVGLGSSVLITASMAVLSMLMASTIALHHSWLTMLPFALGYGCIVFAIDRFLVSLQLNPYRYSANIDLGEAPRHAPVRAALRTVLTAVPRLLFALIIGFLIAEPVLLVLFEPEINTRVSAIQEDLSKDAAERVERRFEAEIAQLDAPVPGAEEIEENQTELAQVQDDLGDAEARKLEAETRHKAECDGDMVTTSSGTTTSGIEECGPLAAQATADITSADLEIKQLQDKKSRLGNRKAELDNGVVKEEEERKTKLKEKTDKRDEERDARAEEAVATSGLLIRIDALEQLATDPTPYAVRPLDDDEPASSAAPAASAPPGSAAAAPSPATTPVADTEQAATGLFGLTILGKVVWTVRLWLVLLDAMPVLFKLILALRRRRPYDVVVARLEETVTEEQTLKLARDRQERAKQFLQIMRAHAASRSDDLFPGAPPPRTMRGIQIQVRLGHRTYTVPPDTWLWVSSNPAADLVQDDLTIERWVIFEYSGKGYSPRWRDQPPPAGTGGSGGPSSGGRSSEAPPVPEQRVADHNGQSADPADDDTQDLTVDLREGRMPDERDPSIRREGQEPDVEDHR